MDTKVESTLTYLPRPFWSRMSLSQKSLSAIQSAGQATHNACQSVTLSLQEQAHSTVAGIASKPFGQDSEHAITRFKKLAQLSQGLTSVEVQLRELYALASELANPASDVIAVLPLATKHLSSNQNAEDALAKPSKTGKRSKKVSKVKKKSKVKGVAGPLTANDTTLLQYLQGVLKADEATRLTGGAMAAGSGLPLGSIGISLRKILASGAVTSTARGQYQLSIASATPVTSSKVATKLAKKTKVQSTKKVKSSADSTDATAEATATAV